MKPQLRTDPSERPGWKLVFRDDFEKVDDANSIPKVIGTTAAAGEITLDYGTQGTIAPYNGRSCLKVQDADATSQTIYYKIGKLADGKIAINLKWFKNSDTAAYEIILEHHDKTTKETYKVKFLESGMKWQYWTSAGAYADITGGAEDIADGTWNEATIILDLTNIKYDRLITNGLDVFVNLSAQTAADAATEGNSKFIFGATTGANDKAAYQDDFRIYTKVV